MTHPLLKAALLLIAAAASTASSARETSLFWGDTHLHTSNSFDVYLFGTPGSTADTAYRFARGLPVVNPTTGARWQLSAPLDFLVISDHAELLGAMPRLFSGDTELAESKSGRLMRAMAPEQTEAQLLSIYSMIVSVGSGLAVDQGITIGDVVGDLHAGDRRARAWEDYIATAERHNSPGEFTTLIGWEWSSQTGGGNLHRVVFTPADGDTAAKFQPFSTLESDDPEDLWAWLDETSQATGADFIAIPHNPNLSLGKMFPLLRHNGDPVDADYGRRRMMWEPVVEATQIKGDSETHPMLSPTDEFADYETYQFILVPDGGTPDPTEGDYLRSGLKRGLQLAQQTGVNPFRVGMIGSTDSHTGLSAVEENNFSGKGQHDSSPALRPHLTGLGTSKGWDMGAAGLVGVWAGENTREALASAFRRKEVYATTGPRITLRFFGGYEFSEDDARTSDPAELGYRKGVPMGSEMRPDGERAPAFLVVASKDPMEANLDRIQIIKGWLDGDGESREKVYDVALSDGRSSGSKPVGNTVDLETGQYSNDIGAAQLSAVWSDPDYDPAQPAFYYVRVLQIPTPRYSLLDSIALGVDVEASGRPATIQERAYSSPIWIDP